MFLKPGHGHEVINIIVRAFKSLPPPLFFCSEVILMISHNTNPCMANDEFFLQLLWVSKCIEYLNPTRELRGGF